MSRLETAIDTARVAISGTAHAGEVTSIGGAPALPYFVPVAHTSVARARLGAGVLLAPEVTVVVDDDADLLTVLPNLARWKMLSSGAASHTS